MCSGTSKRFRQATRVRNSRTFRSRGNRRVAIFRRRIFVRCLPFLGRRLFRRISVRTKRAYLSPHTTLARYDSFSKRKNNPASGYARNGQVSNESRFLPLFPFYAQYNRNDNRDYYPTRTYARDLRSLHVRKLIFHSACVYLIRYRLPDSRYKTGEAMVVNKNLVERYRRSIL